jgi:hypothetical protein
VSDEHYQPLFPWQSLIFLNKLKIVENTPLLQNGNKNQNKTLMAKAMGLFREQAKK